MKIGVLASTGHNIADSVACGLGLMVGVFEMDIFAKAARQSIASLPVHMDLRQGVAGAVRLASIWLHRLPPAD